MSEMSELQQEIFGTFTTNYKNGGVTACRAMVADLKREVDAIDAATNANQQIAGETIANQEVLGTETVLDRMQLIEGATRDCITAASRHSFALFLLNGLEMHLGGK